MARTAPAPTEEIPTDVEPPRKQRQSKRAESDETIALRALRQLRQLDEREKASNKRHVETCEAIDAERASIKTALSGPQAALIAAMQEVRRKNGASS